MERGAYVYMLMNKNNTVIYIGVTTDLVFRVSQHKEMLEEGFTKRYMVTKLVYYEYFDLLVEAIVREKQLKSGSRQRKLNLISKNNMDYRDLYNDIMDW
jgi:putative endonuclease